MKSILSKAAGIAVAGAMTLGVIAPVAVSAQAVPVPVTGAYGYGYDGWGCNGYLCLGQAFVLGNLFAGPYGNGVISPLGTTLGDLLILNQIFNNGWYGWN